MPVFKHLKRLFTDWFLCGMLLATLLAYVFPTFGSTGGGMHAEVVINIGVFLVFFLHGVNLSSEQISHGLKNMRLHLMVQASPSSSSRCCGCWPTHCWARALRRC